MASGTPVIAFDNSATSEVVRGGGVLVADGDVSAMVEAVSALLADASSADRLRARRADEGGRVPVGPCVDAHVALLRSFG